VSWPMPDLARLLRPPRPLLLAADGLWDLADGQRHDSFAAWCALHARQRCTLWVGSQRLVDLVCEAGLPLQGSAARRDWARRIFVHYHGAAADTWALLPWRRRKALGVSALQGLDLAGLRDDAAAQGVGLLAVQPLWPWLLERVLAERPRLRTAEAARVLVLESITEGALATVVMLRCGVVQSVRRRRLDEPVPDALPALLQQDSIAQNAPTAAWALGLPGLQSQPLPVLDLVACNTAPFTAALLRGGGITGMSGTSGISGVGDFLRPLPRAGALAWAWMAVSLLVLCVAGFDAHFAWQARDQALAGARTPVEPAAAPALTKAALVTAAQAGFQQRLAHPWREVFRASEVPAAGGLVWLTLDHQIGGELRLQGFAPGDEPVQRAAATLRARPAWQQVLVSRLEMQGEGRSFEIVARLGKAPQ
jgi:hypothetical protein